MQFLKEFGVGNIPSPHQDLVCDFDGCFHDGKGPRESEESLNVP